MSAVTYLKDTCGSIIKTPLGVVASAYCVGATAVGVAATAGSILTLGKIKIQFFGYFARNLNQSAFLVPPYRAIIEIVNPYAAKFELANKWGIVSEKLAKPLFTYAWEASFANQPNLNKPDLYKRHIVARASYAAAGIVSCITRVADLAIGVVAAVYSLVRYLGRSEEVNNFAARHLASTLLIKDICEAARGVVNPGNRRFFILMNVN